MEERPYTGQLPARIAVAGLIVCCLVDVLQIGVSLLIHASLDNDAHFDAYGMWNPPEWILSSESFLIAAPIVALLFTAVPFVTWLSRAHGYASSKVPLQGDPVLAWFIPFANLWLPYQRVRDVWNVITQKPGHIVAMWWFFWVARTFVARATWGDVDTIEAMQSLQLVMMLAAVVDVIAAFLAARIVLTIDAAAQNKSPTTF